MKIENQEKSIVEFVPFGTKDKISLSIEVVKRLIAVKTKSGKTASDEDAFKFMLMCQARKLNPFEGDAFLIGYDSRDGSASFSLITAHQAFLKRAELHPEFDGMDSGTIVLRKGEIVDLVGDWHMPDDRILGGWATVYFKSRKHPMKKRLRLERFKKQYGIWLDDPAGMIVKCAEADALRSSFPTMLGGMFISEEIEATGAEIARPVFQATAETVAANGGKAEPAPEVEQAPRVEQPRALEEPKKKIKLTRKSTVPSTEKTRDKEVRPNRDKFVQLLALGNCTAHDFMQIALDNGWLELDQGDFEKITEEQFAAFMEKDNWATAMELLEERAAKTTAAAAERGQLL